MFERATRLCEMSPRMVTLRLERELFEAIANGQRVEQALRGMFVRAVASVDDGNLEMARDKVGCAGSGVTHHQAVRLHGVESVNGVEKRLAFFHAGGFRLKVHGVRAETRRGGAETDARARGVFEEGEGHGFAAKGGEFLKRIALDGLKGPALVEKKSEFVRGERFESQKVAESEKSHLHFLMIARKILFQLRLLAVDENDALFVVNLAEAHFDDFGVAGLHGAADELGFNGHFAMAAVDEHAERNALGAAEIEKAVHGSANGAAGVKHVVDEDEVHAGRRQTECQRTAGRRGSRLSRGRRDRA